jgi:hypothetical protein
MIAINKREDFRTGALRSTLVLAMRVNVRNNLFHYAINN